MTTRMRLVLSALLLLWSSGCAMLPQGNIYQLRRDAQLAYSAEEDSRAETLLLGLARAAPNEPETWFYLGNLYARTGRPQQAIDAYQKSLMLNSSDARVWHNVGIVRVREAWASFIQAQVLLKEDDPLRAKLESLVGAMEKLPLDGLTRSSSAGLASPTKAE